MTEWICLVLVILARADPSVSQSDIKGPTLAVAQFSPIQESLRIQMIQRGGVAGRQAAQTLESSFFSVWIATIASKVTFCSIFHDLQD